MWTKSRIDNDEPRRATPKTDKVLPQRVKPRSERDDPRCKKSSTDNAEPMRLIP